MHTDLRLLWRITLSIPTSLTGASFSPRLSSLFIPEHFVIGSIDAAIVAVLLSCFSTRTDRGQGQEYKPCEWA